MPRKRLRFGRGFSVSLRNRRAQAATMVRQALKAGTLLLIERGATHEIRNAGRTPLTTLNLYVPPAYSASGRPLSRGRP